MSILSAHKSDKGTRPYNEDYVWVDDEAGLYILADGLGGQEAGDVASRMASNTIGPMIVNQVKAATLSADEVKKITTEAIELANKIVYDAAHEAGQKRKMGTTIVLALVQNSTAYISHAGDSRAYLLRDNKLTQLTEDDSWITFSGADDAARNKKLDHFLTKSIGQDTPVDPSFQKLPLSAGDQLFLCTDGLWGWVAEDQIITALNNAGDNLNQGLMALTQAAIKGGSNDNISMLTIRIPPES